MTKYQAPPSSINPPLTSRYAGQALQGGEFQINMPHIQLRTPQTANRTPHTAHRTPLINSMLQLFSEISLNLCYLRAIQSGSEFLNPDFLY